MFHLIFDAMASAVLHFVLIHAIWAIPIVLIVGCILVPGLPTALLAFASSTAGRFVIVAFVALLTGWEIRAALCTSWDRSERLRADLAAANQRATIEAARAAENARQALAQRDIAAAAAAREHEANSSADSLQQQVLDYASELAARPAPKHPTAGCSLSDADARRLRGIGAAQPHGK